MKRANATVIAVGRGRTLGLAAGAALLVAAPSAGANVRPNARALTVRSPAGAVRIDPRPFALTFFDARGRRVLREGGGGLSFRVGTERLVVTGGGEWAGNLERVFRAGRTYAGTRLLGARRAGAGVALTLATDDPSGRRLAVTVRPAARAFAVAVHPLRRAGVAAVGARFYSGPDEAFHGFGGVHTGLDQHGHRIESWVQEENADPQEFGRPASQTDLYPNGPTAAYDPQPLFVSSRGYGFLLDQPAHATFDLDAGHRDAWRVDVTGRALRYLVAPGPAPRAIRALTAVTGRQREPPAWGLGPMLDRLTALHETAGAYAAKVRGDLTQIARRHEPLSAYRLEGWALLPRATLRSFIGTLHGRGIHALLYFRAFVARDAGGTERPGAFDYAVRHRLVARRRDGRPYVFDVPTVGQGALLDFSEPATERWWSARLRAALDLGADGFMLDFGEQVLPGMVFHDGEPAAAMHNRYPLLLDRATRRVLDAYRRAHPRRSFWFFTRAGYTGRPGTAAYENANFPGDESTDWTHASGLRSLASDMLNRAVGGQWGYGTDIGGYFDLGTPATTPELFLRWAEWAALSPEFRLHGSLIAGTHVPWSYDASTARAYDALARLHLAARPLILREWRHAVRTGIPVTRPLWLEYPHDRRAARQDQEWLLGPDVLVAPVVTAGARGRNVYFPRGCWRSPATGRVVHGSRAARVGAPLERLPYFFRCGKRPFMPPR
jgi:sulfoquinovosidase